ncbi:serine/threonine-protein kinase [Myceligenerans xiligouense]|uniref:Serine/threonine protein kinase n=1 Tax=Myceligenerans xiligouense TaxID=253184 RepID=A0A3N4ZMK2_9MICO|nr:serine/threonine-protein kinase [Myceligenerans xiligouense]RPF21161.1 serine/threonine protein kinase [Myceligenerans xiligouense]
MPEPLRPHDPARIGAYVIEARLASGGMGDVFLGRTDGGFRVAVKIARQEIADDDGFRGRLAAEVRAAGKVTGLYTAAVVDSDVAADRPWVATEFVDAPTLAQYVGRHGALPVGAVARIGAGIAEGLADIHGNGILHRDLKPANVLMTANGPKVIDFGIARALEETSHTSASTVVGTAGYMSPEQARGRGTVDFRSDVFAFAAVLFFAATGRDLWGYGLPLAILQRVASEEPDLAGIADPRLRSLLAACLAKAPEARPDLDGVRAALRPLADGPPVSDDAPPPDADERADPPVPATERFDLTTRRMRAARAATYLGRIALLPLAALAGAAVLPLFAHPQEGPEGVVGPALLLAALLALLHLTTRTRPRVHDRIELSADGIRVVDRRVLRLRNRTLFVPWVRLNRVRLVIEDDLCAVVGQFPHASTGPHDLWGRDHTAYRHRLGHVLTWLRISTPQQAATVRLLDLALERAARTRYLPVSS